MALEFAATSGFSVGREGIPKIAVVITDGKNCVGVVQSRHFFVPLLDS